MTIALGVGINTGIFSAFNGLALRELPAPDADQLVSIHQIVEGRATMRAEGANTFSTSEYRTYRDRTQSLTGIMGYSRSQTITLGEEAPQEITGAFVTCNYFDVLRQPVALGPGFNTRDCEGMPGEEQAALVPFNAASPNYFSLIGIPIVRGRTFTDAELVDGSPAVIVTEATARRYWADRDPIGQTIGGNGPTPGEEIQRFEFRVVGVAKDAQISEIGEIPSSYLYFPAVPQRQRGLQLLAKSRVDFATTAASIRAAAADLDPGLVVRIAPLEANLELWRNLGRLVGSLSTSLGVLALVLASVGVYSVVAYAVGRRIREIGIRIALGASARSVLTLVLRRTMRPVVAGAVIGVIAAAGMSPVLSSVLFGVSPVDPIALLGAALVVASVALVAGVVPARRAARVDPMRTLHYE